METITNMLYNAAFEGSVTALLELLQKDRLILDRITSLSGITETPLHVAAILGHTDFVKEILHLKPQLARELDSQRSSPLHYASAKGHVEIVKALVVVSPALCSASDRDGRNPLQLAAMKGRVDVLVELLRVAPDAARATAGQGETILHLCVKHNQLEALRLLVEVMGDYESVNAKDDYGMNILHLAVADKQIETTKFLVCNTRIEVNDVNANGFTALDILAQSHRDIKDFDISECLRNVGALRITELPPRGHWMNTTKDQGYMVAASEQNLLMKQRMKKPEEWLTRKRDSLMVVASLIATMAFQSGLNPPGGLWQDNFTGDSQGNNSTSAPHTAGKSIMADKDSSQYAFYLYSNSIGFVASLSIILLLITGLPFKQRFFMWVLTVIVWVTITSMALTYRVAILTFTPEGQVKVATRVVNYGVAAWCCVMALVFLLHTIRLFANLLRKLDHLAGK